MRNSLPVLIFAAVISLGVAVPTLGQVINEDFKLLPSDGAERDEFGYSIAIDNSVVAVGARDDADNGFKSGSAYLFDASNGVQIAKLLPSDGAAEDGFGSSIAIADGVVAVAASLNDDNGTDSGAAYLFDAVTGAQIAKLLPSDGAAGDRFGYTIAIDNGIVAVGAAFDDDNGTDSGSAYLFDATTGAQLAKLLPSDAAESDYFGVAIAIDNGIVAVGVLWDDDNGTDSGSAYLFDASTGAQLAKLLPDDGADGDVFGIAIAIDDGIVAVGASLDDDNGTSSGAAYLFDASTGAQIAKLLPSDGAQSDMFGRSISIDNGFVAVGAFYNDDKGDNSGSAYLFDASTGAQIFKLLPSDGAANDRFGWSIAIANDVVAAGASFDADNGDWSGSAYLFDVQPSEYCLDLVVDNLVAGQQATFTITKGTPGANAATVYGTKPGQTSVDDYAGYCATFGINGVKPDKVIGGLKRTFDNNGKITFNLKIPPSTLGADVLFQSAQHGTCPDQCMSNLVEAIVQ